MSAIRFLACVVWLAMSSFASAAEQPPNIIFMLADDLGYGDLGCYGQQQIQTPHLDQMAREGMRFTHFYAGSTVCAPSRCALMTGYHCGHARIRGNGVVPLDPADVTIAELLRERGYHTALIGKWGLGEDATTGIPSQQGFDSFFGYLNQNHAHNYYPDFLWRGETREAIVGNVVANGVASERGHYSHDLFLQEAMAFVGQTRDRPFFLYLALTIPHANNEAREKGMEVPSDAPYADRDWPPAQRNHAAMITYLDAGVGQLMQRLREAGLDDNTIVCFSSDNGPHREGGADPEFFDSNGPLRGIKRDLYDGGIRVPLIVRWPGRVKPGAVSDLVHAHWDVMPTLVELSGGMAPKDIDGISLAPTLLGVENRQQHEHEYLYWEFHERGFAQAIRFENFKAVRLKPDTTPEIYDIAADPGETTNLAMNRPDLVMKAEDVFRRARTEDAAWPIKRD
ncbi:MAG: arylsulfatase [Planctomycetia bacterium]|nr:arylsulfatase [Planctomycetia bacterium]